MHLLHLPLLALLLTQAPATSAEKPKIIVLELSAAGGVDASVAGALTEATTSWLASRGVFDVLGAREVQTLISVERQRQLMGCGEDSSSCLSELAGALGARFVLSGTLARIGSSYQLTLQTIDSQKAQTVGRATRIAPSLEDLRALLPWAIADATATPPPPRPSNALSYSLVLTGAAAVVGGGVVGISALTDESRIARELDLGQSQQGVLKPAQYYRDEGQRLTLEKEGAAVAMGVGAALIGVGVLCFEGDPGSSSSSVALVPAVNGAALVGVWP